MTHPIDTLERIRIELKSIGMIAEIWTIDEARANHPDLTDEQAWRVLERFLEEKRAREGDHYDHMFEIAERCFGRKKRPPHGSA